MKKRKYIVNLRFYKIAQTHNISDFKIKLHYKGEIYTLSSILLPLMINCQFFIKIYFKTKYMRSDGFFHFYYISYDGLTSFLIYLNFGRVQ